MPRPRNYLALHPLLRKGGSHAKPIRTLRRQDRQETEALVEEWIMERSAENPPDMVQGSLVEGGSRIREK